MEKTVLRKLMTKKPSFLGGCLWLLLCAFPLLGNAQTTVQIGTGTGTVQNAPINAYYGYSYTQTIYLASEITANGGFAGNITKIRYYMANGPMGANDGGWTVYIGNTTNTQFTGTTAAAWIPVAQLTQVYTGTVTFPTAGNWVEITLDTPFPWNGTSNIVVAVDENTPSYGGTSSGSNWGYTTASTYRSIYHYNDNTNFNPASTIAASGRQLGYPNTQFVVVPTVPCAGVTPAPGNTIASVTNICAGNSPTINFSLQNNYNINAGITYQWQSFDGTTWNDIAGANTFTYSRVGVPATTQFRCRVTCDGTNVGYSNPVTVNLNPLPTVSVSPASSISCASEGVALTASGADTYVWSPNTNLSGTTGATVTSTAASNLTYSVVGTITATGCTNTATATVTPIAAYPITVSASPGTVCSAGVPITLTASTAVSLPSGASMEYQWYDSLGTTVVQAWSTSNTYTYTPLFDGTSKVNVKARLSTCPSNESPMQANNMVVGFGATVTTNHQYCGQPGGSIVAGSPFGPLASAVWYQNDFSSSVFNTTQAQLFGAGASVTGNKLRLTPAVNSQIGAIQVYNPQAINPKTLNVEFDLTVGTGADGLSWSFGPDVVPLPAGTGPGVTTLNAEQGSGTGLKIGFDTYGTTGSNVNGIYLMYNCTVYDLYSNSTGVIQYSNNTTWLNGTKHVKVTIDADGKLTLVMGTVTIFNALQLPAAYNAADKSTWKHVIVARTGGINHIQEIDNLNITCTKTDVSYGLVPTGSGVPSTWQPSGTFSSLAPASYDLYMAAAGNTSCNKLIGTYTVNDATTPVPGNTLTSVASVCSNANTAVTLSLQNNYSAYTGITWQWQSFDGTDWANIPGATNSTYTFNGLQQSTDYRAIVACDTNLTGTSNVATVVSVTPPTISVTPNGVTLCTGETPTLTATGADTYVWAPSTGLSATTGTTVTANPATYQEYTVTGTNTTTGCSNISSAYVTPMQLFPVQAKPTQSICSAGVPVTLEVTTIPDYAAGFGTFEYQWLDSTGAEVQTWGADSTFTFTPATEGLYSYFVKMRSTGCANAPDSAKVEFYVGFGGEVSTVDIDCYTPTGTISVSDYFGQGDAGTWFSNNFPGSAIAATQATLHQNASLTGGRMVLTPSATSNRGGFTVLNPTNIQGTNVQYDITFKMTADQPINTFGTGGADGIAYSFGPDANYSNTLGNPCSGFGSKLRVVFDAAGNSADNGNAIGIYISYGYGGTLQVGPNLATTLAYTQDLASWKLKTDVPVHIKITTDGKLSLTVDGQLIFPSVQLPAEFTSADKTTWKHVFSAQTGGDAMRQAIDDLNIKYSALNFGITTTGSGVLPSAWQNTPIFTGLAAGSYDVYISDVNDTNCNKNLGTFPIIDRNPHVDFPTDTVLCAGATLTLDAGNEGSFYLWSTGESGIDEQFYTVTAPGTYTVEVTDTIGCETLGFISVSGSALPVVSLGADTSICSGSSLTLDAGTDGESYLWNNNTTNQTLPVNASGNYSVTVTNDDGCTNTDAIVVTILNAPSIASLGTSVNGQSVAFTATTPQNVNTYEWNFGDGNIITTLSPSINYNYAECGTYTATVTVENTANCGSDNASATVSFECTGVEENDVNGGLSVYPNPASDFIAIANPNGLAIERLTVLDAAGKQMFQSTNASNIIPDITSWASGMYIVKIDAEGKTFVQRVIISR